MNNFEEITKNPETLGAFLRGLPVIEAPWDEAFQRKYCAGCGKVSCDDSMGHCFSHLQLTDRRKIEYGLNRGDTPKQIAAELHVHVSTIYREIKRARWEIGRAHV